jgi:hypothetical protein
LPGPGTSSLVRGSSAPYVSLDTRIKKGNNYVYGEKKGLKIKS